MAGSSVFPFFLRLGGSNTSAGAFALHFGMQVQLAVVRRLDRGTDAGEIQVAGASVVTMSSSAEGGRGEGGGTAAVVSRSSNTDVASAFRLDGIFARCFVSAEKVSHVLLRFVYSISRSTDLKLDAHLIYTK